MMSRHETIKELHDAQKYDGLCAVFDGLGGDGSGDGNEPPLNEWDYIYLMNGLYKCGRYQDGLALYKAFTKAFPGSDKLNEKMGWCVFHLYVKTHDFSQRNGDAPVLKQVGYVLKRVRDGKYAPVWKIVNRVTKGIMKRPVTSKADYQRCSDYLDCVDYKSLSREENEFEIDGKRRKVASDYEAWFSRKTRCLEALDAFEKCVRFCDEGMATISRFHSNNDSWFRCRKAYCLLALGKVAEAEAVAQEILSRNFKNWNVYHLLYDIAVAEKDPAKAMKYAGCCALADAAHEMRVKFYGKFAEFLGRQGMSEEAMLHRQLIVLVKQEKGWTVKEEERQNISETIGAMKKADVLRRLRPFWERHRDAGKTCISGTIVRLFSSGRGGLVKDGNGQTYCFSFRDVKGDHRRLVPDTPVVFSLEDRWNRKKEVMEKAAADVKLA